MTTQQRIKMMADIERHGNQLNAIFDTGIDPVTLCKKLHVIERRAHHVTECLCNTNTLHLHELNRYTGYDVPQATEEEQDKFFDAILKKVYSILKPTEEQKAAIFINHDPRGYALKIRDSYMREHNINMYQDWGGYGILAPDFTPHN